MTAHIIRQLAGGDTLTSLDVITLADGTVWSHAAVLGEFDHPVSGRFKVDEPTVRAFVSNFETGYPSKVPVDYDHGTTNGIADGSAIVRKAGDIVEMKSVFTDADMNADIKAVVDNYAARRTALGIKSRPPKPYGLWVRWFPTPRGADTVKSREYTEMSISFVDKLEDKTGKLQGPTILAVALTNNPFLDDMIPIAASRPHGGSAAALATENLDTMPSKLLTLLSAVLGKPVDDEESAARELSSASGSIREMTALSNFRTTIAAEFNGETGADKIVASVRELRGKVTAAETEAKNARKASSLARAKAIVGIHESKLIVPEKEFFERELARELEADPDETKSSISKILEAKTGLKALATQSSAVDTGRGIDEDTAIAAKAEEIYANDAEIKALAATDPNTARLRALSKASEAVRAKPKK